MGTMSTTAAIALLGGLAAYCMFLVVYYILYAVGAWKINTKAGEAGWKAFIPFYNTYIIYKISWSAVMFWVFAVSQTAMNVLSIVQENNSSFIVTLFSGIFALIVFVMSIIQNYKLSKSFGHGVGYTLGLVFLNPIFIMILGLGSSRYEGPQE